MRTLYLMRHAKSSWSFDELSDQERPLNDRGRAEAPRMGKALAERHIVPDLIVSSPAVRAMSTAVLVARELKYSSANIVVEPAMYQADVEALLAVVRGLPDTAPVVLLTGHNPTLTDVANHLLPSPLSGEMPTASILCLHFQVEKWVDIAPSNAEFYFYDSPKNG